MRRLAAGLALLALVACNDTTTPTQFRNVQVSFATRSPAVPQAPRALLEGQLLTTAQTAALDDTLVTGADTLIMTSVEVVLREIQLKRVDVADCDSVTNEDGCEEFGVGPFLIALPLGTGVEKQFELDIPPGTYSEIEFDVHKVSSDDPEDAAFRQAHPTFVDISIRAQGTFNGNQFVYETDLNVEQELDLVPSLVIAEDSGTTNITILVEVDSWFRDLSGDVIDPDTGNKGRNNESLVNENIKNSFEAFEDDDRDGGR